RLHVGVLAAEQLLDPRNGEVLDDVDDLAAAVVALAGVALRVLVGEDGARRLQHRFGDEVLGGDQLEVAMLPLGLLAEDLGDLGIHIGQPPNHTATIPIVAPGVKVTRYGGTSGRSGRRPPERRRSPGLPPPHRPAPGGPAPAGTRRRRPRRASCEWPGAWARRACSN